MNDQGSDIDDPQSYTFELAQRLVDVGTQACTELTAILDSKAGSQYDSIISRAIIGGCETHRLLEDFANSRRALETTASQLSRVLSLEMERSV